MNLQEGTQSIVICCVSDSNVEPKETSRGDSNVFTAGMGGTGEAERGKEGGGRREEGGGRREEGGGRREEGGGRREEGGGRREER